MEGTQISKTGGKQKMTWKGGLTKKLTHIATRLKESKAFYFWNHICYKSNIQAAPANSSQGLVYIHTDTYVNSYYASRQINTEQSILQMEHSLQIILSMLLYSFALSQYLR